MSREQAERRHFDTRAAKKQLRHLPADERDLFNLGRFTKHHANDCGQPGCRQCGNPRKGKGRMKERLTVQELSSIEALRHIELFDLGMGSDLDMGVAA